MSPPPPETGPSVSVEETGDKPPESSSETEKVQPPQPSYQTEKVKQPKTYQTEKTKPPEPSYETEKVKPPEVKDVPVAIDVTGAWSYSIQNPDGRVLPGEMHIVDRGGFLQIGAATAYSMLWTDGLIHQFLEQSQWVGRVYAGRLDAQTAQINRTMDGYPILPERGQWRLIMSVAPDCSYMEGRVTNAFGQAATITARRP